MAGVWLCGWPMTLQNTHCVEVQALKTAWAVHAHSCCPHHQGACLGICGLPIQCLIWNARQFAHHQRPHAAPYYCGTRPVQATADSAPTPGGTAGRGAPVLAPQHVASIVSSLAMLGVLHEPLVGAVLQRLAGLEQRLMQRLAPPDQATPHALPHGECGTTIIVADDERMEPQQVSLQEIKQPLISIVHRGYWLRIGVVAARSLYIQRSSVRSFSS